MLDGRREHGLRAGESTLRQGTASPASPDHDGHSEDRLKYLNWGFATGRHRNPPPHPGDRSTSIENGYHKHLWSFSCACGTLRAREGDHGEPHADVPPP